MPYYFQNDDDDATGRKFKTRKQDETEYDDPEVLEEIKDADDDDEMGDAENDDDFNEDVGKTDAGDAMVEKVLSNEMVQEYSYDKELHQWCKLTFHVSIFTTTTVRNIFI